MKTQSRLWRLEELASRSQTVLDQLGLDEGESRRVRWEPNVRLLRYYTTLGLLDRAERMEGRTAYYGPRHLLQLLAVKRLQQEGRTLQEIQQELLGLSNEQLQEMLNLPPDWQQSLPLGEELPSQPARARFWEDRPTKPEVRTRNLVEVDVVPGVTLHIDPDQVSLGPEELEELLRVLRQKLK